MHQMNDDIHRDLGKHGAQIEALTAQFNRMHADMQQILTELKHVQETMASVKGSWQGMLMVGGLSAAVGGALVKVLQWLKIFPQ